MGSAQASCLPGGRDHHRKGGCQSCQAVDGNTPAGVFACAGRFSGRNRLFLILMGGLFLMKLLQQHFFYVFRPKGFRRRHVVCGTLQLFQKIFFVHEYSPF